VPGISAGTPALCTATSSRAVGDLRDRDRGKVGLELTELVRYDSGVLLQVYRPARAGSAD
jgi:hypothetical protein